MSWQIWWKIPIAQLNKKDKTRLIIIDKLYNNSIIQALYIYK